MQIIEHNKGVNILAWVDGVPVESEAITQLKNVAAMPFIFKHVAAMPDMHVGKGNCIGSVIPTKGAVIPAAVGCDIGCGMIAARTNLNVSDLPTSEKRITLRKEIERLIPTGRTNNGGKGDEGAWSETPKRVLSVWREHLEKDLQEILKKNPGIRSKHGLNDLCHFSSLGTGNHFLEICLDLEDTIWIMLHSGSRGVGNRIGSFFMKKAKDVCQAGSDQEKNEIEEELKKYFKSKEFRSLSKSAKKESSVKMRQEANKKKQKLGIHLPHPDLAFFTEGSSIFDDYMQAVLWAQKYAKLNRQLMLENMIQALTNVCGEVKIEEEIGCHHNYVNYEEHFGERILVTRKGAISAKKGEKGIIPGSMGSKSYIVEGLGCKDSFCSASHGAGRKMSRSAAKKQFTVEDHIAATEGIECSKDESVIDETPMAYKDIDTVIEAEKELVKPICQLRQIICVKGSS